MNIYIYILIYILLIGIFYNKLKKLYIIGYITVRRLIYNKKNNKKENTIESNSAPTYSEDEFEEGLPPDNDYKID